MGGLESVDDAQLTSGPSSLIDGCLTLGEQGSLKCVLTNSGRLRWKAANTTFMNVYEMQDQMNPNEVLKAVSAMSLDQVVLANGGNEGGSDAVDVLLGSSMRGKVSKHAPRSAFICTNSSLRYSAVRALPSLTQFSSSNYSNSSLSRRRSS